MGGCSSAATTSRYASHTCMSTRCRASWWSRSTRRSRRGSEAGSQRCSRPPTPRSRHASGASLSSPGMRAAAAAVAFMLASSIAGGAASGRSGGCASAGKTVIKGSRARVYQQSSRVSACWRPRKRRVRLEVPNSRWRLATLKGPYVAVAFDRADAPAVLVWVKLGDRAKPRVTYTFPDGGPHPPAQQLYVSPRGAVAFSTATAIAYIAPPRGSGLPASSELDSGSALWADSLWAYDQGHRLYWRNDGVRKSASWR